MWIFPILLRFYPPEYQAAFALEMLVLLKENACEQRQFGWSTYAYFVLKESFGLLKGATTEWRAKLTRGDYLTDQHLSGQMQQKPALPAEVIKAQELVQSALRCMDHAIAHHQFEKARFYSCAERKARKHLLSLQRKYNIVE